MELSLGTAQFGMNYGINNSNGVPKKEEVFDTLKYAYLKGINQLDTASNYGNSEKIIGEFFSLNPKLNFKITTKISSKLKSLEDQIDSSLNRLGTSKVDKILFHSLDLYIHFKNEIIVSYNGTVPNLFSEGKGVIAEGKLKDKKFFIAKRILAKHDENYMPPELEKVIQKKDAR